MPAAPQNRGRERTQECCLSEQMQSLVGAVCEYLSKQAERSAPAHLEELCTHGPYLPFHGATHGRPTELCTHGPALSFHRATHGKPTELCTHGPAPPLHRATCGRPTELCTHSPALPFYRSTLRDRLISMLTLLSRRPISCPPHLGTSG